MLPLKEMILPLVVFDMKKARNPSFLDGERHGFVGSDRSQPLQISPDRAHALPRGGEYHADNDPEGFDSWGFYECRRGPMSFRNLDDSGGIENGAVRESSVLFRVMLPDGSSCIFNGAP
jgi:hypothetical protein